MITEYYFSKLDKDKKAAYYAMLEGFENLKSSFMVPRLEGSELFNVHFLLRLDHPEMFYSKGIKYKYYENSTQVEVIPEYLFDKKKIKSHQQAISSRINKITRDAANMSDEEKLKYIHDFICDSVYYDKLKKQYSHEIIGPLTQGVGVCEGIAKSVKILADKLGLWCTIAISEANPEKGVKYRHAWNVVRVNGKYYHLDATFDNSLGKHEGKCLEKRYDYFMLSDEQIFKDHQELVWPVPKCEDGDSFYYKKKKMSFTKMEDVRKRTQQAVKKGKILTFHWRGGGINKAITDEIVKIAEEEAIKRERHCKVAINPYQAVVRISFESHIVQENLVMEDADEGNNE